MRSTTCTTKDPNWDLLVRYQPPHLAQMRVNIRVKLIGVGPNPMVNLPPVVNPSVGLIPPNISDGDDEFDSEESDEEEHVEFVKFQTGVGEPHGGVRRGGGRRGHGLGGVVELFTKVRLVVPVSANINFNFCCRRRQGKAGRPARTSEKLDTALSFLLSEARSSALNQLRVVELPRKVWINAPFSGFDLSICISFNLI
ncbi:hypothetical protein Tco_1123565 [Tanacetum coccineum]|uniref:C2 domain-containing protein n=1 Tax=Tanacetum coccineum TaxID=301880 RepID=A0ABQ5J559_9ASTR